MNSFSIPARKGCCPLRENQRIVIDVYEVLEQLGIEPEAVPFLNEQPSESGEEASLKRVPLL